MALLLQRVGDILRHIGFVMFGEHAVGLERAGFIEHALGHHALAFAKQIRQNTLITHRQARIAIRHHKGYAQIIAALQQNTNLQLK